MENLANTERRMSNFKRMVPLKIGVLYAIKFSYAYIIKEVSEDLDKQLPGQVSVLVVEPALKTSSKRKRIRSKKKTQSKKRNHPALVSAEEVLV